jgi:S-adenosylmethionine-diacylgycerolhomoserine-N-methlytransferase
MSMNSDVDTKLPEVEHKSSMDRMYRVQRHFYDVTRAYYLLGRDHLIDELQPPAGSKVLEVGCGTGRNIVKAARKYWDVSFHGIDISDEMLKSATSAVGRNNLMHRVKLAQADAVTFNSQHVFGQTGYDRIYFSYTLSMIPNWQGALKTALTQLSPQGELHIVDFGQCEKLPKLCRSVLQKWLAQFHVYPRGTLPDILSTELADFAKTTTFNALHRGYTWHLVAQPTVINPTR